MITQEPLFLDCPFSEKDEVKQRGAQFNWAQKKWFIPPGLEIEPFAQWLPQSFTPIAKTEAKNSLTLYHLMSMVQKTVTEQHNTRYWVRAEILSLSRNVHFYLELSDHDREGHEVAKARAILWKERADALFERFKESTGVAFQAGIKVLLQVRVEFHTRYGFSLDILDIDPYFTLGEIEAQLNRIRTRLKKEGLYLKNKQHPKVTEFCKVAVIAPPQAAGLGDFKSQADVLTQFKLCEFHYYSAHFQGQNITTDIPMALGLVNQAHLHSPFDAVVMIRGGGAKAELFQLNVYEIAKVICTAELPVIVGIGHERDKNLLDEVAQLSCHTPSLVIAHIADTIIQNAHHAKQEWQNIIALTSEILNQAKANTERLNAQIREQTVQYLGIERQQVTTLMQIVKNESKNQLNQSRHHLKLLMEQVLRGDPKMIIARVFAVIRNQQGYIITTKAAAQREETLIIEFKDGQVSCENKV